MERHAQIRQSIEASLSSSPTSFNEAWIALSSTTRTLCSSAQPDIRDVGIMLEFWATDQTFSAYLRLMLAIYENGEYSGMQYVGFFASKITCEIKTDLFVDSWLQDFKDLEELFIHVEQTSAFEQALRLSGVGIEIDSGHV